MKKTLIQPPLAPSQRQPVAPPVYRPQPNKTLQAKVSPIALPGTRTPKGPPNLRQPTTALRQTKAKGLPPVRDLKAVSVSRPNTSVISLKANHLARRTGGPVIRTLGNAQVIQRAEDYAYETDQEQEFNNYEWEHLTGREKLPTIYSYSKVAHTSKPATSEGPHSFAAVGIRYKYEQIVKKSDWTAMADELKLLGDKGEITALMLLEAPNADQKKLDRYLADYGKAYAAADTAIKAKADIKGAALLMMTLENLHPHATYSWKSMMAMDGAVEKKCSHKSSSGKGEKLFMTEDDCPSATRSNSLVDKGCLNNFVDPKAKKHIQHNLSMIFETPNIDLDNYLTNAGTNSNTKKRKLNEDKKKES